MQPEICDVKWKEHNVSNDISPNFKLVVFKKNCAHKNATECREESVNNTRNTADMMTLKGLHVMTSTSLQVMAYRGETARKQEGEAVAMADNVCMPAGMLS